MSKAIVISDVHLHRWTYGSTVSNSGYNSRLVGQWAYLNSLRSLAIDNEINHIICLGDLFHTNQTVHAEVLSLASNVMEYYAANDIKFHCLVGNHDMSSKDGHIHSLDWLRPYGTVINTHMVFSIEGRQISALPYTEDIRKLKEFFVPSMNSELVLLHQGVNLHDNRGSAWVLNEIFTKEMVPAHVKRVLTGHYHRPIDDGKISIVGSPMEHTWSDYDNTPRGCIIIDLDTLEIERVVNTYSPTFLKWDFNDYSLTEMENTFVKVYNCPTDKVEKVREDVINNGALSVEFDMSSESKPDIVMSSKHATLEDIIAEYERETNGRKRTVGQLLRSQQYATPEV